MVRNRAKAQRLAHGPGRDQDRGRCAAMPVVRRKHCASILPLWMHGQSSCGAAAECTQGVMVYHGISGALPQPFD